MVTAITIVLPKNLANRLQSIAMRLSKREHFRKSQTSSL